MAENKTKPTAIPVAEFLEGLEDPGRRIDCMQIVALMQEITGSEPKMWGSSIVGFGDYHYKYASGREGDWFLCGFSPRKKNLTIYIMGYLENFEDILKELGKFSHGKGCVYVRKLEDINLQVLEKLIRSSIKGLQESSE